MGDRKEALLTTNLTGPAAMGTGHGRRPGGRASPVARSAGLQPWYLNGRFSPLGCLVERDFEVVAKIGASLRPPTAAATKQIAKAEHIPEASEDVAEIGKDSGIESLSAGRSGHSRVPVAVVGGTLLPISEHGVRLGGLFEFLFGSFVAGIAVWMVLQRELAVRALDLLVGGVACDT
jgi:hypothetical protein